MSSREQETDAMLERYLQAVRFFLPKRQREDLARELAEDLESEIEEREEELGRVLEASELESLLRAKGHPIQLALGYQQSRYLISPRFFPLYWLAVKVVLGILAILHIFVPGFYRLAAGMPFGKVLELVIVFPGVVMPILAWLTLAFAILELPPVRREIDKALSNWSPKSLPNLAEAARKPPRPAALVLTALAGAWWLVGLKNPYLLLGPAHRYFDFGPVFHRLYVPMAIALVATVVLGWLRWSRPQQRGLLWVLGMAEEALSLAILYLFAREDGGWMVAQPGLTEFSTHERLVTLVNFGLSIGLGIGLIASVIAFGWRYLRPRAWPWRDLEAVS